jgi:uncharacterized protein (DUF362 family)
MDMGNTGDYCVRAVHCDHHANDEEVYDALKRATAPLDRSWAKIRAARRIAIKFNQDWPKDAPMFEGMLRELVSEKVARALLRLLRENTQAELFCADTSFYEIYNNAAPGTSTNLKNVLEEFGVEYVDANREPVVTCPVPGGGLMFRQYPLPKRVFEADAVVSVQKMKNHSFMGITLCLKNLFGLMPTDPHGRPRHYFHHLVRMPYMLVDIGRIFNPVLNILDALTAQAGQEWGYGAQQPQVTDTLIAGDHPIATDACGAYLMGHDPCSDWLTPPFHRDRNALLVAEETGWGTTRLEEIDFQSEVKAPLGKFFSHITDPTERVIRWRRTTAEQGLIYRDHMAEFVERYAGEYILLQQGEVRWHDPNGRLNYSRRQLAGSNPDEALWLKYVDPLELEGEHFEVYEKTLQQIKAKGL